MLRFGINQQQTSAEEYKPDKEENGQNKEVP